MDDRSFKITLIRALEHKADADTEFGTDKMREVIMTLPRCNVYIEETGLFTGREWNMNILMRQSRLSSLD